ncbi:MAG: glycoside hydrolase family 13 protein [Lachnospiraceae bacterium]|nr:glycoside hydrolase family 13 protein [Lachnospiraceae bacterium]
MAQPEYLFHDNSIAFTFPAQLLPFGSVTLILRTAEEDVKSVHLLSEGRAFPLSFYEKRAGFDYYYVRMPLGTDVFYYSFRVVFADGSAAGYDRLGILHADAPVRLPFFLVPGLAVPHWVQGAVMYQILVDRFCNGDPSSDVMDGEYLYEGKPVRKITDWEDAPVPGEDFRHFYGGDLQGVIDKLDYLADLGVEAIYLNPIFVSPSGHKYDTQDYDHVDPHLGRIVRDTGALPDVKDRDNAKATRYICRTTDPENLKASDALFASLVKQAHAKGIRVILDGVFNHCGSFHRWMDRERIYETAEGKATGAYLAEDSPYRDYFSFTEREWPLNESYEGWWSYGTLPKLNYEGSKALEEEILAIGRKWVSPPYNADGWRLDVAADLGHSKEYNISFWKRFNAAVKEANPEAVVLAEHYGDGGDWMKARAWDTVMNYDAFMEPVSYFLTGMEKHSEDYRPELHGNHEAFWEAMRGATWFNFPHASAHAAMNQLSNHDHSRFLTRTNGKVGHVSELGTLAAGIGIRQEVYRQGVVMQFTWSGAPTLYYGDEAGQVGFTDPDNRRTYPWGEEDEKMLRFHRELIRLRKNCPEWRSGSLKEVYSERGMISYGRFDARHASLIVINTNRFAMTRDFHVRPLGIPLNCTMRRVFLSTEDGYRFHELDRNVQEGVLTLTLPPRCAAIVRYAPQRKLSFF